MKNSGNFSEKSYQIQQKLNSIVLIFKEIFKEIFKRENLEMTVKLGMTNTQLINAINSDIDLIKDQGSKIITKEFPASEEETASVQLDTKCQGKDYMFVFMDYGILEPSKYSLSSDGLTVNFSPAIPANHKLLVRYFSYINLTTIPNGLFLGQIIQVPFGIDESKNLGRYLNGQVIIQEQFPAFTAEVKSWVSTRSSLFTTEENWQAEKSLSKLGQCGKFVIDDTAGTIRLPCVVNLQSLADLALIGTIKSESLPNITGTFGVPKGELVNRGTGAFEAAVDGTEININSGSANMNGWVFNFSASRSSSTYQDNAPVQQEAVQYPYYIVVNTGVEEAERPINNYQVNNVYSYGMSQYYKGTMNNNSWLRSQGQWNDGNVYTGMYNWLLEQMNAGVSGFVASTAAYTDYDFVINTADQTFRLPLVAGRVLVAKKEATIEDQSWYNLYSDGWLEQGNCVQISVAGDIPLPKHYRDKSYTVTAGATFTNSSGEEAFDRVALVGAKNTVPQTTNSVHCVISGSAGTRYVYVHTSGYAEVPTVSDYTEMPCLYYYVGDTLQNADLINVARIEEKLVDKADIDASNFNADGKSLLSGLGMPSGRYIDLTVGASGSTYTAPANGWFSAFCLTNESSSCFLLNNTNGINANGAVIQHLTDGRCCIPVKKGDVISFYYNKINASLGAFLRFIYAEGENNV